MYKLDKLPHWLLAGALAATLSVVSLAGCAQKGGDAASDEVAATETTEGQGEGAAGDEGAAQDEGAAGDDAAAAGDDAGTTEASEGAVWMLAKETQVYEAEDATSQVVFTYDLDDHGNITKATIDDGEQTYEELYDYDEDGFEIRISSTVEGEEMSSTHELEKDDQGRVIKSTSDDGTVETRTYDDAGHLLTRTLNSQYAEYDEDGNETGETIESTSTVTFDADGFITRRESEDYGYTQVADYTYERDDNGTITSVHERFYMLDENGAEEEDSSYELDVALEWDENGNLVRTIEKDEGYTYTCTFEYAKIEDPSLSVRIEAPLKYL